MTHWSWTWCLISLVSTKVCSQTSQVYWKIQEPPTFRSKLPDARNSNKISQNLEQAAKSAWGVRLAQLSSVAPPTSTTRDRILGSARGLRFVDLNLIPRVFLRVLRFSSLSKIDFHANIWAIERLNISLWLGRTGNHFLRNMTLNNKVFIYLF